MLSTIPKVLAQNLKNVSKCLSVCRSKHTLPDLPYDYNALEPVISAEIMQLHHQKHHALYVQNLNIGEEKFMEAQAKGQLDKAIALGPALKFNGGGHLNHSIFWTILCPNGTSEPQGELAEAIKRDFGSLEKMRDLLTSSSVSVHGSGWGWLGYDKVLDRLDIASCPNQDPLWPTTGLYPLFGIDVWEHAYYLQYKTARADYVKNLFKIANWRKVEEYYANIKSQS